MRLAVELAPCASVRDAVCRLATATHAAGVQLLVTAVCRTAARSRYRLSGVRLAYPGNAAVSRAFRTESSSGNAMSAVRNCGLLELK